MASIGLAVGLSGATCNGSVQVTPAALIGVCDDGEIGAIWSPLSGGLLCRGAMVVALADTGLIGRRGLTGGGDTGLCCCCGVCRVVRSILEDSPLLELPLSLALVLLLFAAGSLLLPDDMVLQVKLCHIVPLVL